MLMIARKGKYVIKNQNDHQWKSPRGVFNLYGKTVGLLGTGDIATETAKRLKAFGMKTLGMNTTGEPVEYFDEVYTTKNLNEFLSQCDFIVCTLPLTEKTKNLIDKEQFKCMKETAYIINISRAAIFNEAVLYDYLKNHKIAGAALDVLYGRIQARISAGRKSILGTGQRHYNSTYGGWWGSLELFFIQDYYEKCKVFL